MGCREKEENYGIMVAKLCVCWHSICSLFHTLFSFFLFSLNRSVFFPFASSKVWFIRHNIIKCTAFWARWIRLLFVGTQNFCRRWFCFHMTKYHMDWRKKNHQEEDKKKRVLWKTSIQTSFFIHIQHQSIGSLVFCSLKKQPTISHYRDKNFWLCSYVMLAKLGFEILIQNIAFLSFDDQAKMARLQ